jgi:hypothetical protein
MPIRNKSTNEIRDKLYWYSKEEFKKPNVVGQGEMFMDQ